MSDLTPPVLHRAALERVLQRAAELQAASTEVPETLSEADLLALGEEVGISALSLKQALLEERMRVVLPEERGAQAAVWGPATFVTTRVVAGTPRDVLTRLHKMMVEGENLRELRRFPDRVVWEPWGGFAGAIRTLTRLDGRGFPLARADEVSATAVAVDAHRVHVRLESTLQARRRSAVQASGIGSLEAPRLPWFSACSTCFFHSQLFSAPPSPPRLFTPAATATAAMPTSPNSPSNRFWTVLSSAKRAKGSYFLCNERHPGIHSGS